MEKLIELKTKEELKNLTPDNVKLDVALKSHLEKLDFILNALTKEKDAYKNIIKKVLGNDGTNGVFTTESRTDKLLNTDELIELIGQDKYDELKTKESVKVFVKY